MLQGETDSYQVTSAHSRERVLNVRESKDNLATRSISVLFTFSTDIPLETWKQRLVIFQLLVSCIIHQFDHSNDNVDFAVLGLVQNR